MSEVLVLEQQIQLVNIVEIVQSNLSKNFTLVIKRLNHHDTILSQHQIDNLQQKTQQTNQILRLEQQLLNYKTLVSQRFQDMAEKMQTLQNNYTSIQTYSIDSSNELRKLSDDFLKSQLCFQQKLKQKQRETMQIIQHVNLLGLEQNRLNDQISKKENIVQAERIIKETQILKDKNQHIESQLKIAHHKIQKMEILNEKAERLQAKKEVEIFKQIEERVKNQFKNKLNSPLISNLQPTPSIALIHSKKNSQVPALSGFGNSPLILSNQTESQLLEGGKEQRRSSIFVQQQNALNVGMGISTNGNIDFLEKCGEKMKSFQIQLKEVRQHLKVINKQFSKKQLNQNKQNSSQGIKQKLNQIKPQIVKLWTKLDTIDDRVTFNQRRLEEKMKGVNQLTSIIRDNNVSRLQERIKNTHTQVFTNLKEIKAKLQIKINQSDHDKYCKVVQQKFSQVNDLIFLKSDKLQVKKALLFLESKIKQIILVISQDQENEKDALLTKKQLKCISCDKQLDKFSGVLSSPKGNWDGLPFKDHPPEILGRFGMTNYGSLSKKLKRLENKDLPILNKRGSNHSFQVSS